MRQKVRTRFLFATALAVISHLTALVFVLPIVALFGLVREIVRGRNSVLKVALLLAILIHLVIILPLVHAVLTIQDERKKTTPYVVDLWTDSPEKEKTPEQELEEYEPQEAVPDGQVVRVPKMNEKVPVKDTKFLAEKDNRVKEERVASLRIPGAVKVAPAPEIDGNTTGGRLPPGGMKVPNVMVGPPPPKPLKKTDKGTVNDTKPGDPALADLNLNPSEGVMASSLAGTGLDHLDDVIEGDNTQVNTKGWNFASFFNRVKEQVERYWHPDREYRLRDPYAAIYGQKDRETVLLVVLRGDGSLKKAYVMEQSGVPFLDDEAREAVEQGAPFPNVPYGLKDKDDGLVKFTFHFIVQVGDQPIIRMRRY